MYRALTLKALRSKVDLHNEIALMELASKTEIQLIQKTGSMQVLLDNMDVSSEIRSQSVSNHVAAVAVHPGVRKWMVSLQRELGSKGKVVAEGRDVGTVVFPNAKLKIFLIASLQERARRRLKDFDKKKNQTELNRIAIEIQKRDLADSSRETSPLKKATDAFEIDTSNLTINQQVDLIIKAWEKIPGLGDVSTG